MILLFFPALEHGRKGQLSAEELCNPGMAFRIGVSKQHSLPEYMESTLLQCDVRKVSAWKRQCVNEQLNHGNSEHRAAYLEPFSSGRAV